MSAKRNMVLGSFLILCLAGLTAVTWTLRGMSLKPRNVWTAVFGRESVIEEGFEVFASGTRVGIVEEVRLLPDDRVTDRAHVIAFLSIDEEVTLWEGARVVVTARGLLGGFAVRLYRGTPNGAALAPDPEKPLPGVVDAGLFGQFKTVMEENRQGLKSIVDNVAAITSRLERGEGTAGQLLANDKLYKDMERIAANLAKLTDDLNSPESSLGRFLREPEIYDSVSATLKTTREIMERVRDGDGLVSRLLNDGTLADDVHQTVRGVRDLVGGLNEGKGAAGLLLRDEKARADLARTIDNVRTFTDLLAAGDGTIGKLLRDEKLYDDMSAAIRSAREIMEHMNSGKGTIGRLLKEEGVIDNLNSMLESFRESGEVARENAPLASLTSFTSLFFTVLN